MPKPPAYEPVISGKALSILLGEPRATQTRIVGLLSRLAEQPGQLGDYSTRDDTGRDLQHLRLGHWRVSFYADHAVRELRVFNLTKL